MSWVEEETARIKREDERQEAARKWALHKAEVRVQRAVEVWSAVKEQVVRDLAKLNASFSDDEHRQIEFEEIPAFGFSLKVKSGLLYQVIVRMATDGRALKIKTRDVRSDLGQPVERDDQIGIDLDENENIIFNDNGMRIGSIEVVSKIIFKPFLQHFQH
jgi:hypothetical protein